ncbi:hypothetical protein BOO86_19295 [Mycobacterium sp. CBMA 234]|nr:hypothetical protein [Mycolicibacterium sp. CBMA 234]
MANAAPHDVPLAPGTSTDSGGSSSSGGTRPSLPSIGNLPKTFGGLATSVVTAGAGALTGIGAPSSVGQQLIPKFGNGRSGPNLPTVNAAPNTSSGASTGVAGGSNSAQSSESDNIAGTPAPTPSTASNPVATTWWSDGASAVQAVGQTIAAAVDAPTVPVTALADLLPPVVGVPISTVAALPGFAIAQAADMLTATAASLPSVAAIPLAVGPNAPSSVHPLGMPVQASASLGVQPDSRLAGPVGGSGYLPLRGPEPADRTFAADNPIVAGPQFRAGYSDDLRAAGISEVAAVAVPGFTGILVLTGAGGLIGLRQARAGRAMHGGSGARFIGQ